MLGLVVRRPMRQAGKDQIPAFPRSMAGMGMESGLRAWFRPPPTHLKKLSCAASAANWNRRACPAEEILLRCNRSCEGKKKSGGMILAPAGQGKNSKSA